MKSDRVIKLSLTAVAAALAILVTGCYYMPGANGGTAKVAVGVRGVPVNLVSAALVVTAPGMAPITANASLTSNSITVSVPAGPARTFTLLLNGPSATLQGVATVDLQPGENTTINVTPTLGATQIVIPDFQNGRIVQISDMSGTGWTAVAAASLAGISTFSPYAVDFDNLGRIYVSNNTVNTSDGLIRIDDINHTSSLAVVDLPGATGISSLAIDRVNNLIYYVSSSPSSGLAILNVKGVNNIAASATQPSLPSLPVPKGMAVDDQGMLYMAIPGVPGTTFTPGYVVKYNPTAAAAVATSTYSFNSPWGIMVKGPYVYVSDNTNTGGTGKAQIVRLDTNLNFIDSFPGPSTNPFYGPETFVAVLNRKFAVIDENYSVLFKDRLASFDDMSGTNWTTFGSSGSGLNQFDFYSLC